MVVSTLLRRPVDREILRLAVPALGALVAEPIFLLADSAMVGHLGVAPLAGLGIASAVLQTIVGLMVFLAYSTTPAVARRLGAGDERGAVAAGVDGCWLALVLGVVLAGAGWAASPFLVSLFGASSEVSEQATQYLSLSMLGLPAMLLVYAATGLLRGLQDTRTPLAVAVAGFAANIVLNYLFIYVAGLGIRGSALGTVAAQWAMVLVYAIIVARHARRVGASLLPHHTGIGRTARAGGWLFLRTASLRAAMLLAVFAATRLGPDELAAFQVTMTVFATLAFALDALAIAAQALIGKGLGAGDLENVRAVLRRCVQWGIGAGAVLGLVTIALSPVAAGVFTSDPSVAALLPLSMAIVGAGAPLGGYVFVLDGVLIGAGDARYLALTGLANVAAFVPLAVAAAVWGGHDATGLAALTAAFAFGYLGARALTLGLRARGRTWMRAGATI
ncbi:putative efflux protein, MATE family [Leifsonia sp. 98AMF]|uniref:MATE family efflux transporter n=1 Tax=unclassified Leifsonia TaxID=2663824 RepID=UPI00087A1C1B|nr:MULTISPECIES: MATE family efflux transporter [unclassified Leifsonia]SDH00998.1 putative efflux protein, MATE family [Leifsonia sp. 197AMF]SDJ40457.1 putative efflux protein, MATE family [Leifsonia sp. 466MF]SDK37377.1 putative efflux protein, MATE family [Leifsonia sp. 157MF]SDN60695.1 putative efflux protein, MATE family [Leifsonia sp. 509MF]SEN48415.1 putative efflux protein, MATE family [Leifsonia sp. 467MF]